MNNQPKLNTIFLGIIAVSLLILAIDSIRPKYMAYSGKGIKRMNIKTGQVDAWNLEKQEFEPYRPKLESIEPSVLDR